MALKSYRLLTKKKNSPKKKRRKLSSDFVTPAVGAIIGLAFVSQTANVLGRL